MDKIKDILMYLLGWIFGTSAMVVILASIYAVLKGIYLIITY